jgi:hypothetical protein
LCFARHVFDAKGVRQTAMVVPGLEEAVIPVPAVITDITATAADTVVEMAVAHMAVETAAGAIKIKSPVLETMANYGLLGFSLLNSGAKAATIFSARPPFSSEGSTSLPTCHSFQLVMRIQS